MPQVSSDWKRPLKLALGLRYKKGFKGVSQLAEKVARRQAVALIMSLTARVYEADQVDQIIGALFLPGHCQAIDPKVGMTGGIILTAKLSLSVSMSSVLGIEKRSLRPNRVDFSMPPSGFRQWLNTIDEIEQIVRELWKTAGNFFNTHPEFRRVRYRKIERYSVEYVRVRTKV